MTKPLLHENLDVDQAYCALLRQARLGRLTPPIEYEAIMTTQVALAA